MHKYSLLAIMTLGLFACTGKINYPVAEKQDVKDNYFGTEVADPYRWMEDDTTRQVAEWVEAENKITQAYLSRIPFRDALKQRMTELTDYEKIGLPNKKKGKYYFFKNNGLQNQSVLYTLDRLDGEPAVLLDPNQLSDNGTVALTNVAISNDGKYLAYTIARNGSDWNEIFVIDLATRRQTSDHILWSKFSGATWCGDGFYYSAYDAPEAGKEFSNVNENQKIYYHKLGQDQSQDVLAYQNPQYPKRFYSAYVNEDETMLFIFEAGAGLGNRLFVKDLKKPGSQFVEMASDFEYEYSPIEIIGSTIYLITNNGAPNYRIMKADIARPQFANWQEFVAEKPQPLSGAAFVGGKLMLTYSRDAADHAYVCDMEGREQFEVALPTFGSFSFSGDKDDKEIFYSFTSFLYPPTIFRYDIDRNESQLYLAPKIDFDPDQYVSEQVFFASKDGTRIPMFLTYRKDLQRDGNNPVYLYGYGGFNISLNPGFSTWRLPFIENGGIFAMVNLRGGGEYGDTWHQAGIKTNKQNVFDDCIAAAEYLIAERYTRPERMSIAGGSNGGLLVGAVVNQRPDLFAAALPMVGVMDMLRYHKFTIGWNWASDYGTSEDSPEMFQYLYGYSPLHNIKNDGTPYPAILVSTADHDDRVVPAHSFKYTATLQAASTGDAPKLISIETDAGHGSGKPMSKQLQDQADNWAFVMYHMGMKPKF
ncbi:MAG: S9 family peptidase [Bacteroidales bacterium]|nr:S9 family peptidase [Bacteroidales bacterium]